MTEVVRVDLGGTKVAVARLRDGRLGDSLVEPKNRSSATALIDQLDELVERVGSNATSAVGIGVPSVVSRSAGGMNAPAVPWLCNTWPSPRSHGASGSTNVVAIGPP
jgi:predicted NBD/HSP70 family sugar kinase